MNHELLIWARETAGLSRKEAAKKLNIKDARGLSATKRLADMEGGITQPTRSMLIKMTKSYRRPLLTFYLSAPPKKCDRGIDFRTLPPKHSSDKDAFLDALIRDMRARQSMVRTVLEAEDEAQPLPFVGSKTMSNGKAGLVKSLQDLLGIEPTDYYNQQDAEAAFSLLRKSAEKAGVFVLLKGDLGSYHTSIDLNIFRGFAIADAIAPFVIINNQDAKPAFSFTLLHELVHLTLGQTGISGASTENATERFCNDVAGEFLLPKHVLDSLNFGSDLRIEKMAEHIDEFAQEKKLSSTMIAYKSWRSNRIKKHDFDRLCAHFRDRWLKSRGGQKKGEGSSYYVVHQHHIGKALIDMTRRMMGIGALTTSKAAKILGVKPKNVGNLFDTGKAS